MGAGWDLEYRTAPAIRYTGVVLAGGQSRRLGRDKRFLELEGRPLIAWVLERLAPLVDELLIVASDPTPLGTLGVPVVTDRFPGQGVLAGVHAGLAAAQGEWAFVVAADMPWLNPALLQAMSRLGGADEDAVVPRWRGELEPLHALYRPAVCAPAAEAALQRGERRVIAFYPAVRVRIMEESAVACWDPAGQSFSNINTAADWENALRRQFSSSNEIFLPEEPGQEQS